MPEESDLNLEELRVRPVERNEEQRHRLVLLETFMDPQRFQGTVYHAANWSYLGHTRGFRRTSPQGYSASAHSPKK